MYSIYIQHNKNGIPTFFIFPQEEWNPDPENCEEIEKDIPTLEEAEKKLQEYVKTT